jgi:adenylylsulfate kinase
VTVTQNISSSVQVQHQGLLLGAMLPHFRRALRNWPALMCSSSAACAAPLSTAYDVGNSTNIKWHEGAVPTEAKEQLLGQKGCVIWFTGLSGSGKSTVACTLEHALHEQGHLTALMDGDNIRHGLNANLGFSAADREENIRRIGEVAKLFADSGVITLVSFISPYRKDRDRARSICRPGTFIECYMKVPLDLCEARDPKGLYKKARAGQLKGFTGIDDPYEEPEAAELVLEAYDAAGQQTTPQVLAAQILSHLRSQGIIS